MQELALHSTPDRYDVQTGVFFKGGQKRLPFFWFDAIAHKIQYSVAPQLRWFDNGQRTGIQASTQFSIPYVEYVGWFCRCGPHWGFCTES